MPLCGVADIQLQSFGIHENTQSSAWQTQESLQLQQLRVGYWLHAKRFKVKCWCSVGATFPGSLKFGSWAKLTSKFPGRSHIPDHDAGLVNLAHCLYLLPVHHSLVT